MVLPAVSVMWCERPFCGMLSGKREDRFTDQSTGCTGQYGYSGSGMDAALRFSSLVIVQR